MSRRKNGTNRVAAALGLIPMDGETEKAGSGPESPEGQKKRKPRERQLPENPDGKNNHSFILKEIQEEIKMVKVIIQTEDETRELEGKLFFGAVVTDQEDGHVATECLVGKMAIAELPRVVAKTAVSTVKHAHGPREMVQMAALAELKNEIEEAVDEELCQNKEGIISDLSKFLDGLGKEKRRKQDE